MNLVLHEGQVGICVIALKPHSGQIRPGRKYGLRCFLPNVSVLQLSDLWKIPRNTKIIATKNANKDKNRLKITKGSIFSPLYKCYRFGRAGVFVSADS